jgi:hypothetical protein
LSTDEVQRFLENVTLEDLQKPETWPMLCALVRLQPDADILPVRSRYGEESQYTIATNYLTSDEPLWFTLADCVFDKLLAGKRPKVLEADLGSFLEVVPCAQQLHVVLCD